MRIKKLYNIRRLEQEFTLCILYNDDLCIDLTRLI